MPASQTFCYSDKEFILRHASTCPGCRAVFTDPVAITGPVTNDELAPATHKDALVQMRAKNVSRVFRSFLLRFIA